MNYFDKNKLAYLKRKIGNKKHPLSVKSSGSGTFDQKIDSSKWAK